MNSTHFFAQDSTAFTATDTAARHTVRQDSLVTPRFSTQQVDDIFKAMEQRERTFDSIARVRAYQASLRTREQTRPAGFDTASVPYYFDRDTLFLQPNPLASLAKGYFSSKDTLKPVFLDQARADQTRAVTETGPRPVPDPSREFRPDWLLGIIIGCLVMLAWLKLFYNKFLDQTMQSLFNYQLSTKLLRDQNIFSRRVGFLLNIHFVLVGAALAYLILGYFHIRPFNLDGILSYLAYAGILSGFLILRYLTSHAVGYVFDKHYEFREYIHQLLLIYKNLGIYLLVLVIGIAYIREDLRAYLVYLAFLLLAAAVVFRIFKGLKIILSKKEVLIFYLILYLCTLEILPVLVFYRFFSLSIQAG